MSTMKNRTINKLKELITKGILTESEVNYFLNLVRKYIEYIKCKNEDDKEKYILLNFFCDWACHFILDRSTNAIQILQKINDVLVKYKDKIENDLMIKEIAEIVSFLSFREQIIEFLKEIGLEYEWINNNRKWENFVHMYIEIIIDCPLVLCEYQKQRKIIKEYANNIISNPVEADTWVIGFAITRLRQDLFFGTKVSVEPKFLAFIVYTSGEIIKRIIIPLTSQKIIGWKIIGQNAVPFIE